MTFTAKHGRKFREYLGLKYLYEEIRPRGDCNSRVALQHLKGSKLINTGGVVFFFFLPNGPQLTASLPARRGGAVGSPVMASRQQGLAAGREAHVSTSVPCIGHSLGHKRSRMSIRQHFYMPRELWEQRAPPETPSCPPQLTCPLGSSPTTLSSFTGHG